MGGSVNRVIVVGHLGRDAELRTTATGASVATLSLATSETWTDKTGQKQERTEWHRVSLCGKQADTLAPYLVKGKQIYVEGRLQTNKWRDKDGQDRTTTEIRCDRVVLLGAVPSPTAARPTHVRDEDIGHGEPALSAARSDFDDDVPF